MRFGYPTHEEGLINETNRCQPLPADRTFIRVRRRRIDNAQNVRNQTQNQTKPIHVSDRNEVFNRHNENEQFGYVRYQKEQFDGDQQKTPVMNREETAHMISSLTVQLPHIQDAATLVTDREALVVYKTDSKTGS